ncbi:MAG TPA: flagellar basal body L-ring protein FlgH [Geminicoccaceae bacterium]|nr:flagellar basal body L-ring protein FlgH [Geminicoccaceae bacterium]
MRPARALVPLLLGLAALLGGCNAAERLGRIGREPELSPIENPVARPGYQPVALPMPAPESAVYPANSLWRTGARRFFKDQRARTIGDILTVEVTIKDRADLENKTSRARTNAESLGIGALFGFEATLDDALADGFEADNAVDLESGTSNLGRGSVARTEQIDLDVAAVVVQVLPNGNFVVQGRQEVRVNFEVRELYVAGVVRPEDITPQNRISHEKIAELRVAYGGRGVVSDIQQPRYGSQVLDVILPF